MLPVFAIERPDTAVAAAALLGEESVAYCGGTEILLAMKMGLLRPQRLVDLKGIPELNGVAVEDSSIVIGAATCHDDISRNPDVRALLPLLAQVEARVGNIRVRAQGSIGGNLCFAEPRSDLTTTLLALGADLTLQSGTARRTVSIHDFLVGPYSTSREDDELLVDIRVPLPAPAGVYLKFQTSERPVVGVAAVEREDGAVRVVVGAVCDVPVLVEGTQREDIDATAVADDLQLVSDNAGSVRYKRHVTGVYINRALDALSARSER